MNGKAIMKPRNIKDVLSKLDHVTRIGPTAWRADCPCGGHTTPGGHLVVTDAGTKALVKCFTHHTYEEIISALGFESLAYSGNTPKILATYNYTDAEGRLLYQIVRLHPKTFRVRRPDGNGGWIWNLKGITPVLYSLPKVLEAIRNGEPIYICEGEKDCDNLAKIGLVATTNSGGAGKWAPEFSQSLAGASVVVIPDKDEPGRKHAAKVAASIYPKAKSVKILNLPDKAGSKVKDISDWLMAGGTREELEQLASETHEYKPEDSNLVCMAEVEPETVDWLWFPYIPVGKLTLLEGDPGIGKSWVSLAIATAVSLGEGLPKMEATEPGKVLVASAEDGLGDTIRPRLDAMGADVTKIYAIKGPLDFGNGGLTILDGHITCLRPRLVIIDPLVAYIGPTVDIHRANETRAVMAKLADIAERHSVAILAIRHLTKSSTVKPVYRGLGSIDLAAACRSILMAGCDPEDINERGIVHIKSNLAPTGPAIGYRLTSEGFCWTGHSNLTWQKILAAEDTESKSALEEASDFLRDELADGPVDASQVWKDAREIGLSEKTVKRAKVLLGIITRRHGESGRRGGGKFTWELPHHLEAQKDLGGQGGHIKNFGPLNQNSFENGGLPKGVGPLNPDLVCPADLERHDGTLNEDDYDKLPLLGLTPEQVIEIWRAEGSPRIKLSECETCNDLARTLCHGRVSENHVAAITQWLRTILRPQGQPLPGRC